MEINEIENLTRSSSNRKYALQVAQISLFSGFGVIVRILSSLNTSTILPAILYPQMIGCFIMGMITKSELLAKYPYLRLGLSTGLSGSITSFSSFAFQATNHLIYGDIWNGFMIILLTMSLSYTCFILGRRVPFLDFQTMNYFYYLSLLDDSATIQITSLMIQISAILWFFLDVSHRSLSAAAILGPLGSLARFGLSKYNRISPSMPYGTLIANSLATALFALVSVLNSSSLNTGNCILLFAISNGFCGSLSTISTFVTEIYEMEPNEEYKYISISIILGIILSITIYGIPIWAGKNSAVCLAS